MVAGMRPGSVVVDLAASTGGNVEGTVAGEEVTVGGVRLVGLTNLPGTVARDASQMYASNVSSLIAHLWDKEAGRAALRLDDELTSACLLTHEGKVRRPELLELIQNSTSQVDAEPPDAEAVEG